MKHEYLSLEHLHKDILKIRDDIGELRMILQEDMLELSEDAKKAVAESRKRKKNEFVSHEDVLKKFG